MKKARIHLVIERPDGRCSEIESPSHVSPDMLVAAEDLLHVLTTGEPAPVKGLYDLCAVAFGLTREDCKERLFAAAHGMDKKAFDKKMRLA